MLNWKKEGTIRPENPKFVSNVTYYNKIENPIITSIQIQCMHYTTSSFKKSFTFGITFAPIEEISQDVLPLEDEYLKKIFQKEELISTLIDGLSSGFHIFDSVESQSAKQYESRDDILKILDFLLHSDPAFNRDFRDELLAEMTFKKPESDLVNLLNRLLHHKYRSKENVSKAISLAIQYQEENEIYDACHETIWALAEALSYESMSQFCDQNTLYNLYENISKNNPHYTNAQSKMLQILNMKTPPMHPEVYISLLEAKFRCAMNSKNHLLSQQYFNELCGTTTPDFPQVIGDPDFLILIAQKIRNQQNEIEKLKSLQGKSENDKLATNPVLIWNKKRMDDDNNSSMVMTENSITALP